MSGDFNSDFSSDFSGGYQPSGLTVVDLGDGTGATATISGSDPSAENTVYAYEVDMRNVATGSWLTLGTRIGDGTLALSLTTGIYWAYCLSTVGGISSVSNLYYFTVSDIAESVHYRCMLAVQGVIRGLLLPGIDSASVVVQKQPWARKFGANVLGGYSLPGIIISPFGEETMNLLEGTNARDDIGYPVLVSILAADNQDLQSNRSTYLHWRQSIARSFRTQRLPGVNEIMMTKTEPKAIGLPDAFLANYYHSAILFRFISREPRGIGA